MSLSRVQVLYAGEVRKKRYECLPRGGQVARVALAVELELGPAAELVDVVDEILAEPVGQVDKLPLALLVPRALNRRYVLVQGGRSRALQQMCLNHSRDDREFCGKFTNCDHFAI